MTDPTESRPDESAGGAHTDFAGRMSYGDYLALGDILAAQHPRTDSHDEMLFIVIHQATELWMKLAVHELGAAMDRIARDDLSPCCKMLTRVSRIQAQLIQSWDVLSTLTPAEYLAFRGHLGQASGFQSYQYRLIEFMLGNKNRAMLRPHAHAPEIHGRLEAQLMRPSIYDEAIRLLARRGLEIDAAVIDRDWSAPYRPHTSVKSAWAQVYGDTARFWDLYELAEKLVDLEDWFQQWRFRHMTTVERIIGHRAGTGGTAGVGYLRRALDIRFFPELWDLRTDL